MKFDLNELSVAADDLPENEETGESRAIKNSKSKSRKSPSSGFNGLGSDSIRHLAFAATVLVSSGVCFWFRSQILGYMGWSLVPVGAWAVALVYLLFVRTSWIFQRARAVGSSLLICLGGSAVLGIFDAPLGAASGATMGGMLGEYLAREPFEWDRYNVLLWQQILGWVRASLLFALGVGLQFPTGSATGTKLAAVGALIAASYTLRFMSSVASLISSVFASIRDTRLRHGSVEERSEENSDELNSVSGRESSSSEAADPYFYDENQGHRRHVGGGEEVVYAEGGLGRTVIGLGRTLYAKPDSDLPESGMPMQLEADRTQVATVEVPVADVSAVETELLDEMAMLQQGEMEVAIQAAPDRLTNGHEQANRLDFIEAPDSKGIEQLADDTEAATCLDYPDELRQLADATPLEAAINDFRWYLPSVDFMSEPPGGGVTASEIEATSRLIEETLEHHAVDVTVDQVRVGPTVTMYGLKPGWKGGGAKSKTAAQRVRVDAILNREKDIALALKCPNIRFESVVPGASVVGIEVPNADPTPVNLRSVIDSEEWAEFVKSAALPVPLGMGSGGDPIMADFAKMPHTLVAGATGSGKSVCMNTIVAGLLLCRTPIEVRMVMIDPKRVELTPYQGIPHLYTPVVVEAPRAVAVLKALTREMMERFATLESAGVKNIATYNERATMKMPYLLIVVDELADLMLTASNEVEQLLVRLAQLGRATGVHLVVATQRPSVDVVTGLIKANFPSRISFSVMSQVDSRTILDSNGAEKLLGKGDMLYKPIDLSKPVRVQGAYVSEDEVETVVNYWTEVGAPPLPQLEIDIQNEEDIPGLPSIGDADDALLADAKNLSSNQKTLSTSLLQRRLKIGYPRAARLMDDLEDAGIVGPGEPGKPRKVL